MYMPTTLPGISITKAGELLQTQDRILKNFPRWSPSSARPAARVRATNPAPVEMMETIINLKPKSEWRPGVTTESLKAEMDRALQFPGVSNAWTMPIRARIDSSRPASVRPSASKFSAKTSRRSKSWHGRSRAVIKAVPGTTSAYAERVIGGYYLDIVPDRAALARYGLMVGDVQDTITMALGGEGVTNDRRRP